MVTFKFMEERDGKTKKSIQPFLKKARGAFLTALMEGQVTSVEEIKKTQLCRFPLSRRPVYWQGIWLL